MMAIIRWDPFQLLRTSWPFEEGGLTFPSWSLGTGDNLEVGEENEQIVVRANVAGVDEKDIDVTFKDGRLWIKAELSEEEGGKQAKFYKKMSRSYSYVVDLPLVDLKGEAKSAELEKGVLTLVFEKAEEAKPKKIAVKSK